MLTNTECVMGIAPLKQQLCNPAGCNSVCPPVGRKDLPLCFRTRCNDFCRKPPSRVRSSRRLQQCPERTRTAVQHVPWTVAHAAPPSALAPGASTGGTTHSLDSGEAVCTGSGHLFRAFPLLGEKLLCCFLGLESVGPPNVVSKD